MKVPLREREYLTPTQAGQVFGHGADFWRSEFDAGRVDGYRHGRRQDRHLRTESCRALLASMHADPVRPVPIGETARETMRVWREKRAAAREI